jgi:hypothetical protein
MPLIVRPMLSFSLCRGFLAGWSMWADGRRCDAEGMSEVNEVQSRNSVSAQAGDIRALEIDPWT